MRKLSPFVLKRKIDIKTFSATAIRSAGYAVRVLIPGRSIIVLLFDQVYHQGCFRGQYAFDLTDFIKNKFLELLHGTNRKIHIDVGPTRGQRNPDQFVDFAQFIDDLLCLFKIDTDL